MSETAAPPPAGLDRKTEEEAFYHESALNGAWTASRLMMGLMSFGFGAFVFAYFYLRSLNSSGMWHPANQPRPSILFGTFIMAAIVVSAFVQYVGVQRLKAGEKRKWQIAATLALLLGLASVAMEIIDLQTLSFWPGSSGFASLFTGFHPVFLTVIFVAMIFLETLLMRSRSIPAISFVEQPPTYRETFRVQRFQASLSAFTAVWNYLAVIAILFWVLFYVI